MNQDFKRELGNHTSYAKSILINININEKTSLFIISDFMGEITKTVDKNADFIFAATVDNTLGEEEISFEVLLTGLWC